VADATAAGESSDVVAGPAPRPAAPLRGTLSTEAAFLWGAAAIAAVLGVWYLFTAPLFPVPVADVAEAPLEREYAPLISPVMLPGPGAVFQAVPRVFTERKLVPNTLVTLKRVLLGFGLAAVIGVPLGVAAACFPAVRAFLYPVTIFGRNIPVAALIPLTFFLFGIGEFQKVMFLFVASVAFVISDATAAVLEVPQRYVDTALTLGASRLQIILKVLVPLAAPVIFNSLRLLFGLAFGYVMLAELVKFGSDSGGLGDLINISQRRGDREPILIVLIVIPLLAYAIDRALWWLQCDLFPYRYGGRGRLRRGLHRLFAGASRATEFRP
jgi:ABC-type nitrate/sulfonate/bicarbonate transport system permease component